MATINFLTPEQYSNVFSSMFGQSTQLDEHTLIFTIDPMIARASITIQSMGQATETPASEVTTIEVPDHLVAAIKANALLGLKQRWSKGYDSLLNSADAFTRAALQAEKQTASDGINQSIVEINAADNLKSTSTTVSDVVTNYDEYGEMYSEVVSLDVNLIVPENATDTDLENILDTFKQVYSSRYLQMMQLISLADNHTQDFGQANDDSAPGVAPRG